MIGDRLFGKHAEASKGVDQGIQETRLAGAVLLKLAIGVQVHHLVEVIVVELTRSDAGAFERDRDLQPDHGADDAAGQRVISAKA